jgi:hypothetical protein
MLQVSSPFPRSESVSLSAASTDPLQPAERKQQLPERQPAVGSDSCAAPLDREKGHERRTEASAKEERQEVEEEASSVFVARHAPKASERAQFSSSTNT